MTQRNRRIILVLLVLVLGFGWGENSGQTKKSRPPKPTRPALDFKVTAKSRNALDTVGEPILVDCTLTNTGSLPLHFVQGYNGPYKIRIRDKRGTPLRYNSQGRTLETFIPGSVKYLTLNPDQTCDELVVLGPNTPIKEPGTYTMTLIRTASLGPSHPATLLSRSTKIRIQVVQREP